MKITQNSAVAGISTCAVGIFSVLVWVLISHPAPSKLFISPPESVPAVNPSSQETPIPNLRPVNFDENNIKVEYAWSLAGVESLDATFYVTNNTDKTIRYLANDFGQASPFWIRQSGKIKKIQPSYIDGIKEQEIKSFESAAILIPVPQNEKPFEAGFRFLIGDERKERIIPVKVEKQLKSDGLACTKEIMEAGGILSKTCITTMPNFN